MLAPVLSFLHYSIPGTVAQKNSGRGRLPIWHSFIYAFRGSVKICEEFGNSFSLVYSISRVKISSFNPDRNHTFSTEYKLKVIHSAPNQKMWQF